MRIAVTGSSGRIGRYVVRELVAAEHSVVGLDVAPGAEPGCRYLRVDLTDAGQVYGALAGVQAVVHMGAWAHAGAVPDTRTYGDNTAGTFNVFQACADLGIRRVVSASSNQVYGFAGAPPLYAPVDEDHPCRPVNCYALSKMAGEQAADYFVKQKGLEILSFRILGTRTDARDVASACRLAIEVEEVEPAPYNIAGPRVVLEEESRALVERYFGERTELRDGLQGFDSPLSCAKARRVFGWTPRYAWSQKTQHPEEENLWRN